MFQQSMKSNDINQALLVNTKDLEDCLSAVYTANNHCDAIVTRNFDDFQNFGIRLLIPKGTTLSVVKLKIDTTNRIHFLKGNIHEYDSE